MTFSKMFEIRKNETNFHVFSVDRTCGPEEWTCRSNNGQCIPLTWVCDDHNDCDDKSDEEVCSKLIN